METEIDNITFRWRADCRYFVGALPCRYWRACQNCEKYAPITFRVLIVMLGLLGDMLIASALPGRIKRDRPGAHVTWLVDAACAPILEMNPDVDRVMHFDWHSSMQLLSESFDAVYSFERTPSAAALVDRIPATYKAGLAYGGEDNTLYPIGEAARHFFLMNTWNDYRTQQNLKSWTELYFEVAGYTYNHEPYVLEVPRSAVARVKALLPSDNVRRICLNIGGSHSTKVWPAGHWLALGRTLLERSYQLVITGGASEEALCVDLLRALAQCDSAGGRVCYSRLSLEEFAAIPAFCDVMVTGDSLGFHLALANQCPCVLLLGPSNGAEVMPKHVDTVRALRSSFACSPCAHQMVCGGVGGCMNTITVDDVITEVTTLLVQGRLK